MKCERCGRGLTYHRVERDAAFVVFDGPGARVDRYYCGQCFYDEVADTLDRTAVVAILLGDSPNTEHWEPIIIEQVAEEAA